MFTFFFFLLLSAQQLPYVHPISDFISGVCKLAGASEISFGPGIWTLHHVIFDLSDQPLNFRTKGKACLSASYFAPFFPFTPPFHYLGRHAFVCTFIFSTSQFKFRGPVTYDAPILLEAPHAVNRALKARSKVTPVYHCFVSLPTIIPPPQRLPAASCRPSIQCSTYPQHLSG